MQFRNKTDEYFADGLKRFGSRYDILRGSEFELRYNRLIEKYGRAFELSPVTCRDIDGVEVEAYRTKGHPFFVLFYATQKDAIGSPFYVMTELHGQISRPDTLFKLDNPIGLSLAHAHRGGIDHLCFTDDLEFLIVRDQNDIVAGYGRAAGWLKAFRKSYPELIV
ncbi:hypothetical protein ACFX5Q_13495 [Mesorhizobium sp. IMUNJ 23033]|uniref:hypothetical protein n=1 Tax=Mesorhizobium sp. IMUNJ 23033 TaxID=3378039 RepID=UPI00384B7D78